MANEGVRRHGAAGDEIATYLERGTNDMAERNAGTPKRLKGQTLRLSPNAWLNLKLLAAILDGERGSRVTQHDLLLEAVEDLFVKYRKHFPADSR